MTDQDLGTQLVDAEPCCPAVTDLPFDDAGASDLAKAFSALGDPVRLHVLDILAATPEGEVCVCELIEPLGRSQPTVSHHLKVLSDAGLIHGDRRGKWVWYSLDADRLASLRDALDKQLGGGADRRVAAGRSVLDAEPMEVPDGPELLRELDALRSRRE